MQSLQASERTATVSSSQHPTRFSKFLGWHSRLGIGFLLFLSLSGCGEVGKVIQGIHTAIKIYDEAKTYFKMIETIGQAINEIKAGIDETANNVKIIINPLKLETKASCAGSSLFDGISCKFDEFKKKADSYMNMGIGLNKVIHGTGILINIRQPVHLPI